MAAKGKGRSSSTSSQKTTISKSTNIPKASKSPLEQAIDRLLKQGQHQKALDEIKKARRTDPNVKFSPTEEEIIYQWGMKEFHQENYRKAESCFSSIVDTSLAGEGYYWLARSLLMQNRVDPAFKTIKSAFESEKLPKAYAICYLKLLLIKGQIEEVETLITTQAKRFTPNQLGWAKGALAFKAGRLEEALAHFQEIKTALTPGDEPLAWVLYTHQAMQNWPAVKDCIQNPQTKQGMGDLTWQRKSLQPLGLYAVIQMGDFELLPKVFPRFHHPERSVKEALDITTCVQAIRNQDFHRAGSFLLDLTHAQARYPELSELRVPLLRLAGQQAMDQQDAEAAQQFWSPLLNEKTFDPQLAVNLFSVQYENCAERENQRLLTRLLKWVEEQGKQHRDRWPDARLKPTLADIHCRLGDTWIAMNKYYTAVGSIRQAERICPDSPEVIGRKGLLEMIDDNYDQAIVLMQQALEQGCKSDQVYVALLKTLEKKGDRNAANEIRRKFGKRFGDGIALEREESMVPWVEVISIQHYGWFNKILEEKLDEHPEDPALKACEIFKTAVGMVSPMSENKKVSFDRTKAEAAWDKLLAPLSPNQKVSTLQAIVLCMQMFAKTEKGLANIINKYLQQLEVLGASNLEAQAAYFATLIVRKVKIAQVEKALPGYLSRCPQPGTALAKIQLLVRCFTDSKTLAPFLDNALQQEPRNAQLLLAKATLYPRESKLYEEFHRQGFELARQLQDQAALKAFRQEKSFLDGIKIKTALPILPFGLPGSRLSEENLEEIIEKMARDFFGSKVPPNELENLMDLFRQEMMGELIDSFNEEFEDDEDDDDFQSSGFHFPFGNRSKSRKRKG